MQEPAEFAILDSSWSAAMFTGFPEKEMTKDSRRNDHSLTWRAIPVYVADGRHVWRSWPVHGATSRPERDHD